MFFGKKRKYKREPTPDWLRWVFIGFILFALVSYQKPGDKDSPNPLRDAVNKASDDIKSDKFLNYSEYSEKVFPSYVSSLRINDTELGKGLPAVCGQQATVSFTARLNEDTTLGEASSENPLRFVIGEGTVMPVFEQGIIGMQPGGSRQLIAPMQLSYGAKGFEREELAPGTMTRFDVTLHEVSPPLPNPDDSPYRIAIIRPSNGGRSFICGETVTAQLTLWDMRGATLFTTYGENKAPLNFTLGRSQVFAGLEQGVIGMRAGEQRMLIVPPTFQKPLRENPDAVIFPLPENETILVEVELLP